MIQPPVGYERRARLVFCRETDCQRPAVADCSACHQHYCHLHLFNNVPDGVRSKGLVCVHCRDMWLSRYTGVRPEQFKTLGETSSGE